MYTINNPAQNITELVNWLDNNSAANHLFRGQNKDYGTLIPSSFRQLDYGKQGKFKIISKDGNFTGSDAQHVQQRIMDKLINDLGADTGSYLAQQYLCFSQSLDFSASTSVAAFFATYHSPSFASPLKNNEEIGVIYRLDASQFSKLCANTNVHQDNWRFGHLLGEDDSERLDLFLLRESAAAQADGWTAERFYFSDNELAHSRPQMAERHFVHQSRVFTIQDFSDGLERTFKHLDKEVMTAVRDLIAGNDSVAPHPFLRPIKQMGGVVTPATLWTCEVPEDLKYRDGRRIQSVWGKHCIGIEDLYHHPGIEKFYFKHAGIEVNQPTRELLWPSGELDPTLMTMCLQGEIAIQSKPHLNLSDIIDFGYL